MFDFDISVYAASFLAIAFVHLTAVMSPGPDLMLTIRNSLLYSRRVGVAGAIGTTTGILIHLTYTVFGIGYLVSELPWLMNTIRIGGALYLFYLGYMSFKNSGTGALDDNFSVDEGANKKLSPFQAFRIGMINNLLNPMVILLFIGILSVYITPETPSVIQGLYGVMMITLTFVWFTFVAVFFSIDKIRLRFLKMGHWLEKIAGSALIVFGLKVAYLTAKAF